MAELRGSCYDLCVSGKSSKGKMAELRGNCYDLWIPLNPLKGENGRIAWELLQPGKPSKGKAAELRGSCYDLCVSGNSGIRKTAELRCIATNCARPEILDSRKTAEWRRGPFHQAVICAFNYIRHLILQTSPIKFHHCFWLGLSMERGWRTCPNYLG